MRWAMLFIITTVYGSSGGLAALFQEMFPDSQVAKKLSVSSAKVSYMINHGLAPYFKDEILIELTPNCPRLPVKFVLVFGESFNRVSTTKEMDVQIIYFDETKNRVKSIFKFSVYGACVCV